VLSSQERPPKKGTPKLTQLLAQFVSNPFPSAAHSFAAFSPSLILSIISWLSKHLKYMSRASQHFERSLRFGAMGVPSVESLGAGGEDGAEDVDQKPIVWCMILQKRDEKTET
jgi:hypothetical protein